MSFDPNSLLVSFVMGMIGTALFVYGKKQQRVPHMIAGVLYAIYPYFVDGAWMMLGVGVAIGLGLWVAIWYGY